jgi:uncharacterized membrane protein YjdF
MDKNKKELLILGALVVGLLIFYSSYEKKSRGVSEDEVIPTEFEN